MHLQHLKILLFAAAFLVSQVAVAQHLHVEEDASTECLVCAHADATAVVEPPAVVAREGFATDFSPVARHTPPRRHLIGLPSARAPPRI